MKTGKLQPITPKANYNLITVNYFIITLFLPLLFSCHRESNSGNLERALELAGENRIELEKVLEHYGKDPADSLKLKAAGFLIENMDTYFFITSPELEAYYNTLDSIFTLNNWDDYISEEQEILLSQMNGPNSNKFKIIPDLQYVSAEFLIDNIDRAFEAWKSPFAKELSFEDFCEYLLPYKANPVDRPDFWRSVYRNTFYPYIKSGLETILLLDSSLIFHHPAIELNGENYFSIPDNLFDTVPEFTVCSWVKPSEYIPWARVFSFGTHSDCYVSITPYTHEGLTRLDVVLPPAVWDTTQFAPFPLAQPTHVAFTYSKNNVSFYIDGVLKKRMKTPFTDKDFITNYIGKSHFSHDSYFKGEIGDFRVYGRELNYAEISALAGKTDLPEMRGRLLNVVRTIRHLYNVDITLNSFMPGGCRPVQLMNMKKGSCGDYTVLVTYIFRSLGIPSGLDFMQWATRSAGHQWNALYTGNGRMEDYAFGDWWDSIGYHLTAHHDKAAKIYRRTYAKQPEIIAMQNRGEELPPLFGNPCIKDVTDNYLNCTDITVCFTQQPPEKRQYAYLSNFDNRDWIPVHWGEIKFGKAVFTKMGKDIAYLPVYYDWRGILPAAEPFILTAEGEIKKLIPDHSKKQSLILTRKYRLGRVPKKGELLSGGRFQVANRADFSDSLTVHVVNEAPEIRYNPVNLTLNKSYRYFRFWAPHSQGGEISEIEIYSTGSGQKLSGKVTGNRNCPKGWEAENVFDGDPLTSYKCEWWEKECWVGLDFGKPEHIAGFRFLPRNDDNFIKEGEEYELFYWDNHRWNSLGRQIGTSKQYLEYTDAPSNALFWLRNLTKGREERIFTYEDGGQVWW